MHRQRVDQLAAAVEKANDRCKRAERTFELACDQSYEADEEFLTKRASSIRMLRDQIRILARRAANDVCVVDDLARLARTTEHKSDAGI